MSHIEDSEAMSRHAADWGLASLLMAGFLLVAGPVVLVFNLQFWMGGPNVLAPEELRLAFYAGIVAVPGVWILCLICLAFGIKAVRSARIRGQPCGLPTAGVLLSVAALVVWIIVGADLLMILFTFVQW